MQKKFLALFLAGALFITFLGNWQASSAQTSEEQFLANPITLAAGSEVDDASFRPSDREQSSSPYDDDDRVIIGRDNREPAPVLTRGFPWSTIGRLEWSTSLSQTSTCTGTLVGRDLVLTNAHCLPNEATGQPQRSRVTFKPSMIEGVSLDEANVTSYEYGTNNPGAEAANDWALLKLDQPLGDIYGYMGWQTLDFSNEDVLTNTAEKVLLAGYSGDFPTENFREFGEAGETAGVHVGCSVLGVASEGDYEGILFHECDTNPGASGSPIFALFDNGQYKIVGLHAGSFDLGEDFVLPSGDITGVVNRGVQVSRWARQAHLMR